VCDGKAAAGAAEAGAERPAVIPPRASSPPASTVTFLGIADIDITSLLVIGNFPTVD
jgi:hypothetical protein